MNGWGGLFLLLVLLTVLSPILFAIGSFLLRHSVNEKYFEDK